MSRAGGRRGTGRAPDPQYGSFDKGIPGGIRHVDANPDALATVARPAVAEPLEEFRGMMAHGVAPGTGEHYQREMQDHARHPYKPEYEDLPPAITPVPVYVVEEAGGSRPFRSASPRHITVPASTAAEPARICSVNPRRIEIRLLNEDTATDIRFGKLGDLSGGGGGLLPWPANTYLALPTQDELFAIGATGSGTPLLSIIEIFEEQADR
jgi:hypothetical protein